MLWQDFTNKFCSVTVPGPPNALLRNHLHNILHLKDMYLFCHSILLQRLLQIYLISEFTGWILESCWCCIKVINYFESMCYYYYQRLK